MLDIPAGHERYAVWVALILGLDALSAIPFARLRLQNNARKFAAIKLANIVLNVGLNLFFIVLCPAVASGKWLPALQPLVARLYDPTVGVGYVFLSNLVASGFTLLLLWRELLDFRFRLNLAPLRPLLKYAYPLMLMGLAGMVNETLDRILLPKWLPNNFYPGQSSLTAVGIYGACYKLSIFMSLVIQAFRYAAEPFFFSQSTEKNSPATFAMILKWFTLCCAVIFVGISLNVEDFGQLFLRRPEYLQGLVVVPVLLLANLFLGMYYNLSVWFKLTDRTYYGTYIGAGGAVLTIALNFLLIPILGYLGCAIATLVCYFTMAVLCWRLGERHFPVPYPALRLGLWLVAASALVGLGWWVQFDDWWMRHAWHAGLTVVFLLALYLVERPRTATPAVVA
ncbi:polysaccharide biosynthesis C-terminal domain-containing protein [Hymenobacter humi]|uniref:Polysaccharide biosynthesis C-terminal domain-containing protein n=1 Tax=Hymenobacter humi TaxID=1411620 RepID=A0ABW2U1N3_9BACT